MPILSSDVVAFCRQFRLELRDEWRAVPATRIPKNTNAYRSGQRDGSLYLIEAGQIKTVVYSRDGRRCMSRVGLSLKRFRDVGLTAPTASAAISINEPRIERYIAA